MDVIMVTAEALPFAKTGGLADVCGALPSRLAALGHRCSVFMPGYGKALQSGFAIQDTHIGFVIDLLGRRMAARIVKAVIDDGPVDYYFIDQPHYFDRPHLYGDQFGDYGDNCERFSFFCRSVVEAIDRLHLPIDIVHCHDWQSGLVPAYVKTRFGNHGWYERAGVVTTIHNLAYQGRYWVHDMPLTGLDWRYFNADQMEFYNDLSFLKTGIVFADMVTTVSPTYALEICRPEFGCGMDGVLRNLEDRLTGIVNGVDYRQWDPRHDEFLPQSYGLENWQSGKAAAKALIQQELGLPIEPNTPMIGLVGRLAGQKGWDLVIELMRRWTPDHHLQWAVLGSGEERLQHALLDLAGRFPHRIGGRVEFSNRLAHLIEAASDIFLMPSLYEPCGLNQLYSLRYGAVPVVHAVGGLVDTVVNTSPGTLAAGTATGFAFYQYDVDSMAECVGRALDTFRREPTDWTRIVETGIKQDWSWNNSAQEYERVYARAKERASLSNAPV
jgi:starch synthase